MEIMENIVNSSFTVVVLDANATYRRKMTNYLTP